MDKIIWILLALAAGSGLPIQAGLNSKLAKTGGSPLHAAMISFSVGVVALALIIFLTSQNVSWKSLKDAPACSWMGGFLGAFYVSIIIYTFPRIGPAFAFSLIIAGQLLISMIMEHYQILGAQPQPINLGRIAGLVLIIGGVLLMKKF
jgi:transporter family-2 protein